MPIYFNRLEKSHILVYMNFLMSEFIWSDIKVDFYLFQNSCIEYTKCLVFDQISVKKLRTQKSEKINGMVGGDQVCSTLSMKNVSPRRLTLQQRRLTLQQRRLTLQQRRLTLQQRRRRKGGPTIDRVGTIEFDFFKNILKIDAQRDPLPSLPSL
jgi:hypothetical protein